MSGGASVQVARVAVLAASALLIGAQPVPAAGHGGHTKKTLRQAAPRDLRIGTAVAGGGHHLEQDYPDPFTRDRPYRTVLAAEFDSASPENQMKWEFIHPERNRYNFGPADAIVRFARRHGQAVRGHTLLWHSQNPAWLAEGAFTKAGLRSILEQHIFTVVGRYRGQIHQWDVANEIFNENGEYRQENIFIRELGPEIVADAFRWAHQADPRAQLFLNDYEPWDPGCDGPLSHVTRDSGLRQPDLPGCAWRLSHVTRDSGLRQLGLCGCAWLLSPRC